MPNAPVRADYGKDTSEVASFLGIAANHDPLAGDFLLLWNRYVHEVDDIIDENRWEAENLLAVMVLGCQVFSHPFYVAHREALFTPALLATSVYADSVKWEKDPQAWKRRWAAYMGHAGSEVIFAVALITGGWEHLRGISAPLLAVCHVHHEDKYGPENS